MDASQSRIHTLSGGLLAWQDSEDPVLSHFIICNNTNHAIKFGQVQCSACRRSDYVCLSVSVPTLKGMGTKFEYV